MMQATAFTTVFRRLVWMVALAGSGCVSAYVNEQQSAERAKLDKVVIAATDEAPGGAAENGKIAPLKTVDLAGVTFSAYAIGEDDMRKLHAASGGEADIKAGSVIAITLVQGLLYPIIPIDLATAAILRARHESVKLDGRTVILAYGSDGAYRWHLCCPKVADLDRQNYPRSLLLHPDSATIPAAGSSSEIRKRTRERYGEDYWTIVCTDAKAGDATSQNALAAALKRKPAPGTQIERYFWLKQIEHRKPDDKGTKLDIYSLELDMTPETLLEARRRAEDVPLDAVDCRGLAGQIT